MQGQPNGANGATHVNVIAQRVRVTIPEALIERVRGGIVEAVDSSREELDRNPGARDGSDPDRRRVEHGPTLLAAIDARETRDAEAVITIDATHAATLGLVVSLAAVTVTMRIEDEASAHDLERVDVPALAALVHELESLHALRASLPPESAHVG